MTTSEQENPNDPAAAAASANITERYVAFCDILGFSDRILNDFSQTFDVYRGFCELIADFSFKDVELTIYSDAVLLVGEALAPVLSAAQGLWFFALARNLMLRGAITKGHYWELRKGKRLFVASDALVRAVKLEKMVGVPAILIADDVDIPLDYWLSRLQQGLFVTPLLHFRDRNIVNPFGNCILYNTALLAVCFLSVRRPPCHRRSDNPIFQDATAAREWLEALLWPDGPVCPHCGLIGAAYALHGKKQRAGLYKCKGCDQQFTVTIGTVFERSHIPLNKWVFTFQLMAASKKGVSAHQVHRMLGVTYKSAWFMCHRIREALTSNTLAAKLGGENKVVEIDETYVGGKEGNKHKSKRTPGSQGGAGKAPVLALVERGGSVRSQHVANVNGKTLGPILHANIDRATHLMTDDATVYPPLAKGFAGHSSVNHSAEEYVRLAGFAHTNTVENYFSILKRGIVGVYHHVSEAHLHRYLAEFDFRYNQRAALGVDDTQRMEKMAKGISGKRLTYRRVSRPQEAEEEIPF